MFYVKASHTGVVHPTDACAVHVPILSVLVLLHVKVCIDDGNVVSCLPPITWNCFAKHRC